MYGTDTGMYINFLINEPHAKFYPHNLTHIANYSYLPIIKIFHLQHSYINFILSVEKPKGDGVQSGAAILHSSK